MLAPAPTLGSTRAGNKETYHFGRLEKQEDPISASRELTLTSQREHSSFDALSTDNTLSTS